MTQFKVKDFGPIRYGGVLDEGFIDIGKITIFIGNQGTGKSTVAKLFSTLSWLEKQLYLGNLEEKDIVNYNRFPNKYCQYHNLKNYFSEFGESQIFYKGNAYHFYFNQHDGLKIEKVNQGLQLFPKDNVEKYVVPKIMYIPSERNFFSVVNNPEKIKGLPKSVYEFWEELDRIKQEFSEDIELPINAVKFHFDESTQQPYILGNNYRIKLSEASSGFQSVIPLFLVSQNIALSINNNQESSRSKLNAEEQKSLQEKVQNILNNDDFSEEIKDAALKLLSSQYRSECFINVVEEPEQNLYPESQKNILYKLLEFANLNKDNKLIITTHSPYLINYLTLAIKANQVLQKILDSPKKDSLKPQLEKIVPEASCVSEKDVFIYELTEKGEIEMLDNYEGLPSDENYLNISLGETNNLFSELLEIEEELEN